MTISDADDQLPISPTQGFTEVDYEITKGEQRSHRTVAPRDVIPDLQIENPVRPKKNSWYGVIVRKLADKSFSVLRQDGKLITATALMNSTSEVYKPGIDVAILEDQQDRTKFVIIGKPRQKEIQLICVKLSTDIAATGISFIIPFDTTDLDLPVSDTFHEENDHKAFRLLPTGEIEILKDGLYEICFDVAVEDTNSSKQIIKTGCWLPDLSWVVAQVEDAEELNFNEQCGFQVLREPSTQKAMVRIKSPFPNAVLNQRDNLFNPVWTDTPIFNGALTVGASSGRGILKLGDPIYAEYGSSNWLQMNESNNNPNLLSWAWIVNPSVGRTKFMLPPSDLTPFSGSLEYPSFLKSTTSGLNVLTQWRKVGPTGTVSVRLADNSQATFHIADGLVVNVTSQSITGYSNFISLTQPQPAPPGNIQDHPELTHDPCEEVADHYLFPRPDYYP